MADHEHDHTHEHDHMHDHEHPHDHDHEHTHEHPHEHEHEQAEHEEAFEREARRLVALSRIRQYGDSVLRMKAREVETFDDDLERLVERMTRLMHEANGVGLAATQVGVLRRLFVFTDDGEDRVLVNPVITKTSK
jgi:peptide deformylase